VNSSVVPTTCNVPMPKANLASACEGQEGSKQGREGQVV
jgi:hypothetical protein